MECERGVRVLVIVIMTLNSSPAKYEACDGATCTRIAESTSGVATSSGLCRHDNKVLSQFSRHIHQCYSSVTPSPSGTCEAGNRNSQPFPVSHLLVICISKVKLEALLIWWDIITDRVSIHNVDNLPGQVVVPDLRNRMGEDFAQLLQTALGLRSARRGPLLLARSIK